MAAIFSSLEKIIEGRECQKRYQNGRRNSHDTWVKGAWVQEIAAVQVAAKACASHQAVSTFVSVL
jgi:hypothetical protein